MANMNWNQLLEAMDEVTDSVDSGPNDAESITDSEVDSSPTPIDDKALLAELNTIFTPVLVMQGYQADIADKVNAAVSEAAVLTEMNMMKFDEPARMAQLIAVCARLINKQRNTPEWQLFKKAAILRDKASNDMQKKTYDEAKTLAQKYLVMVSTTNNSSEARDAANDLLPQTQH